MSEINSDNDYLKRYKINKNKIKNTLNSFKGLRVTVIGDNNRRISSMREHWNVSRRYIYSG